MGRDYGRHCDRAIVSLQWNFCPYCAEPINASADAQWLDNAPDLPKNPVVLLRPDGMARRAPFARAAPPAKPLICQHRASKGKHKGDPCYRDYEHKGKHRYAVMPLFDF